MECDQLQQVVWLVWVCIKRDVQICFRIFTFHTSQFTDPYVSECHLDIILKGVILGWLFHTFLTFSKGPVGIFTAQPRPAGRARAAEPGAGSPAAPGAVGPRFFEALGRPGGAAQRHGAADAESQPQPGGARPSTPSVFTMCFKLVLSWNDVDFCRRCWCCEGGQHGQPCPWCIQIPCPEQVEGGLEVFQNHPKLKVLDLEGTMVEGSIEVFQFTPGLEVLKIGGAGEISGDIKVFEHTPNLKVLALNATALEGDMEVFSVYTKGIRQLSLINALRVTGHLPNLLKHRTFHNLKKFVLINSSGVTGSVKHFLAAKKLQEMRIENAEYINGDLSLLPIPSLRSLILKGITMEVDFTALDRKYRMKNPQFNLSELHLEPEVETSGSTRLLKLPARRQSRLAGG